MVKHIWMYFLMAACSLSAQTVDVVDYIRPIVGASTSTDAAKSGHGLGKTFPGSATPFGLVQLSPDTETSGDNGPGYSWHHKTIEGFSFIHMSGIGWYGDFGNFLVTPSTGTLHVWKGRSDNPEQGYCSRYSHDTEVAEAGYYAVNLDDYDVRVELSSMPRAGIMRMTYPKSDTSRIQIDLARRIGGTSSEQYIRKVDDHTLAGWMKCTPDGGGWGHGAGNVSYTVYFYCQLDKPLKNIGIWSADIPDNMNRQGGDAVNKPEYQQLIKNAKIFRSVSEAQGKHIGFFVEFPTSDGEQVLLKSGISFVSIEGAKKNLEHDIPHWDFDKVRQENRSLWRNAVAGVEVEGATEKDKRIFYTALYHTMIDPRSTSDVDGSYVGADNKVYKTENFTYRTIFSGWDVFRSQFPLQTIINPSLVNDEINSLISIAEKSGRAYFPRWEIMNSYSGCMIGNPAVSVLTDAYNKNIRNYDADKAYRYAVNSVEKFGNGELGYRPGSISETLEYAYTDWCVAKLSDLMGKKNEARKHYEKSLNYKNIWNDEARWFRGRKSDGTWENWRDRLDHGHCCVESNPYQQGWFVPHDVYGFEKLMGKEKFEEDLIAFFDNAPADFLWNDYYNHPNEPVHQVPFMFNYIGKPYLTQKWTRAICEAAYGDDVMGLCGNEDVGQMSAWYILAAIGIHPVCPGDNIYLLTSPVFSKIVIRLDNNYYSGKEFTVIAHNNSKENKYIQKVKLNGKTLKQSWIKHEDIVKGGKLEFFMGSQPNTSWGSNPKTYPPNFK